MKLRYAVAALLLAALPLADSEAFIFRRMRERRSARMSARSSMRQPRASSRSYSRGGGRWSVAGRRSYSSDYIRNHLLRTHNVDCTGMTMSQMQSLHDDLHEGRVKLPPPSSYKSAPKASSSCPGGKCPTSSAPKASGGCPGGNCPTSRSAPSRRWSLFRR